MTEVTEYECKCEKCVAMCECFPCRPLPSEVAHMPPEVRARLMIQGDGDCMGGIPHLQAGAVGHEGDGAPHFYAIFGKVSNPQRCTFLTDDGLCELHGKCKPFEGRIVTHDKYSSDYMRTLEDAWDSDEGREVLAAWQKENI